MTSLQPAAGAHACRSLAPAGIPAGIEVALAAVSPGARAAFGVIGTLAHAPFHPQVLAAALGVSLDTVDALLGELMDAGLVLRQGRNCLAAASGSYAYARRELSPAQDVLMRLATFWVEFARAEARRGPAGAARLDPQRPHLLAVQEACLAAGQWMPVRELAWRLADYLPAGGHWQEQIAVLRRGLAAAHAEGQAQDEEAFVNELAVTYFNLGELGRAVECYEWALHFAQERGDRAAEARALINLGAAHFAQGEFDSASEFYVQALALARSTGDRNAECAALGELGTAYYALGAAQAAAALHGQQLALARTLGSRAEEKSALTSLGNAWVFLNQHAQAIECYEQCLALATEDGDAAAEAAALWGLGACCQALGALERAAAHYERQVALHCELGDRHMEAWGRWHLGETRARLGNQAQAAELMQSLVDYLREIDHPEAEAFAAEVNRLREER